MFLISIIQTAALWNTFLRKALSAVTRVLTEPACAFTLCPGNGPHPTWRAGLVPRAGLGKMMAKRVSTWLGPGQQGRGVFFPRRSPKRLVQRWTSTPCGLLLCRPCLHHPPRPGTHRGPARAPGPHRLRGGGSTGDLQEVQSRCCPPAPLCRRRAARALLQPLRLSPAATAGGSGPLLGARRNAAAPPRPRWMEKGLNGPRAQSLQQRRKADVPFWLWGGGNTRSLKPPSPQSCLKRTQRHPHCLRKITLDLRHPGHHHFPCDSVSFGHYHYQFLNFILSLLSLHSFQKQCLER